MIVVVVVKKVMGVGWLINGDGQQVPLHLLGKLQRGKTSRHADTSRGRPRLRPAAERGGMPSARSQRNPEVSHAW